jgi:sodium pump decarboxylase gamma subunit
MEPWLLEGLTALVAGMSTVFIVLILISVIISLFKYINRAQNKSNEVKDAPVVIEPSVESVSNQDELELVAVITAAIAASLNTTTDKLHIKSFRRVNSRRSWSGR